MRMNSMVHITTEKIFKRESRLKLLFIPPHISSMKIKTSHFVIGLFTLVMFSCKTDNRQVTSDMIHFPPSSGESDEEAPIMTFDSVQINFGKIAIGEKVTHSFKFTNTGKSPLIISQVNPSCGCTTPKDWPTEPIAPGESGQITVEFNSKGFPGKVDKSVSVLTNCIPRTIDLKIFGEVVGVEKIDEVKPAIEMHME